MYETTKILIYFDLETEDQQRIPKGTKSVAKLSFVRVSHEFKGKL